MCQPIWQRFFENNFLKTEVKPYVTNGRLFKYFRWDADNLPIKDESVNVIFDRAGWVWHCAGNPEVDETRMLDVFVEYYKKLKVGGVLVLDASDDFEKYVQALSKKQLKKLLKGLDNGKRPSELIPDTVGSYQISSVSQVDKAYGDSFWSYVGAFFDIEDVGEGKYRVRVLKKKI